MPNASDASARESKAGINRDDCRAAAAELAQGAESLGFSLSQAEQEQFVRYCSFLLDANSRTNLTALRTPSLIMRGLFLDSLTLLTALPDDWLTERGANRRVVDVGSGAGIPGVPLKILLPKMSLTLVESIGKKARFLQDLVRELDLGETEVRAVRAEEIARRAPHRDTADLCIARAVAALPTLLELCAPFVAAGGLLLLPRSGDVAEEVRVAVPAARALRVCLERTQEVSERLGLGQGRVILVYRKTGSTSATYPRRVGLARSQPIGVAGQQERGSARERGGQRE